MSVIVLLALLGEHGDSHSMAGELPSFLYIQARLDWDLNTGRKMLGPIVSRLSKIKQSSGREGRSSPLNKRQDASPRG